jgi:hypothetical protein
MSIPFRLDDAGKMGRPFTFTFRGTPYTMPPLGAWPITVMEQVMGGRMREAIAVLLGEAAADRLTADGMTVGHMTALFDEMGRAS